jgi:aralkylamine N-acetyltransferase
MQRSVLQVGFPRRNEDKLRKALDRTHTTLWIRCTKSSRWAKKGQLLGFARADSDGSLTATIWDVAVHPAWQRMGFGRALVERLVRSLIEADVDVITLYAEPQVVLLYEKLGFCKDVQELRGMAFQKTTAEGRAFIAAATAPVAA